MRKLPLLFALILLGACARKAQPPVLVVESDGTVRYQQTPDAVSMRAQAGQELPDGSRLTTDRDGRLVLGMADGTRIVLGPRSELSLEKNDKDETTLNLSLGRLKAKVAQLAGRRLSVRTPRAVACVRGTEFGVAVAGTGRTTVDLYEGKLSVEDGRGKVRELSAGQRIVADAEGLLEAAPIPDVRKEAALPGDDLRDQAQAILPRRPKRGAPMTIPDAELDVDADKPLETPK